MLILRIRDYIRTVSPVSDCSPFCRPLPEERTDAVKENVSTLGILKEVKHSVLSLTNLNFDLCRQLFI